MDAACVSVIQPAQDHANHFVAFQSGRVVAAERDLEALVCRLRRQHIDERSVLIEFLGPRRIARIF